MHNPKQLKLEKSSRYLHSERYMPKKQTTCELSKE